MGSTIRSAGSFAAGDGEITFRMDAYDRDEEFMQIVDKADDSYTVSRRFKKDLVDIFGPGRRLDAENWTVAEVGCYKGFTRRMLALLFRPAGKLQLLALELKSGQLQQRLLKNLLRHSRTYAA